MALLQPDPHTPDSIAAWDDPRGPETMPMDQREDASHDEQAIGDVVDMLRLTRRPGKSPVSLNYYREALDEWPTSLAELQRPIPRRGQPCYRVRLTPIGSGAI